MDDPGTKQGTERAASAGTSLSWEAARPRAKRPMANTTSNQRPTKTERREQARRERAELQRKMARARRNRRIVGVALLIVAVGLALWWFLRPQPVQASPDELLRAAPQAREQAGCGPVGDVGPFQPEERDAEHVPTEAMPPLSDYPSVPPASGPHNEIPWGAGVYDSPPPIDRVIHSLEHGAAVVWYSPEASGEELQRLRDFYAGEEVGARVIVAPYDYPTQGAAGVLPAGAQMALVSWHNVQTCANVSLAAAFGFTAEYAAPPFGQRAYRGSAPEAGAPF